ncbi:MAG: GIY-YIG nuclease family protein [Gemmatimonadetes bacterium]|nr:GIY-YIG nuclease family protein [Gemmatimonadota bacterium]
MHYTYVLFSERDGRLYTGTTSDLRARLKLHAVGNVQLTRLRRPLTLLYYQACLSADDAYRGERYLKSGRGGRYLRTRLASSLTKVRGHKLERHEVRD